MSSEGTPMDLGEGSDLPHRHVHIEMTGRHAHVHRHPDGTEHSHMHVHDGDWAEETAAGPPYLISSDILAGVFSRHGGDPDDETGVLLDGEGRLPAEAYGRHCIHCGEEIEVSLDHGGAAEPGSVQEYRHKASRTVHCVMAWQGGIRVGFTDGTASPCWKNGCMSNAEYEAREALAGEDRPAQ